MNIFAEQLVDVLSNHHHELSNLFSWKLDIPPSLVVRLKASLTSEQSATLNSDQIDFLAEKYDLDEDDLRRLRAALLAEAVRKMIANRIATALAYKLGMVTLNLLLSDDPAQVMSDIETLVTQMRDLPDLMPGTTLRSLLPDGANDLATHTLGVAARDLGSEDAVSLDLMLALDGAMETFHQGQLWLEVARDTFDRRVRAGYAAHAQRLFERAADQGRQAPAIAQGSDEQQRLLDDITQAQTDARSMLA